MAAATTVTATAFTVVVTMVVIVAVAVTAAATFTVLVVMVVLVVVMGFLVGAEDQHPVVVVEHRQLAREEGDVPLVARLGVQLVRGARLVDEPRRDADELGHLSDRTEGVGGLLHA